LRRHTRRRPRAGGIRTWRRTHGGETNHARHDDNDSSFNRRCKRGFTTDCSDDAFTHSQFTVNTMDGVRCVGFSFPSFSREALPDSRRNDIYALSCVHLVQKSTGDRTFLVPPSPVGGYRRRQTRFKPVEMAHLHPIVHLHAMVSLCALPCVHLVHKSTGDRISLVTTVSCRDSN
jgi:hypothetical protein